MKRGPNLVTISGDPRHDVALIGVPYAGGGTNAFCAWRPIRARGRALILVQPPGRESRLSEKAFENVSDYAHALAEALAAAKLCKYVLFGHSYGALVAFETTRLLVAQGGPLPSRLIVSARQAPQLPRRSAAIGDLPDQTFIQRIASLGGFPDAVLQDTELMRIAMPALRADFRASESYEYQDGPPLPIPIVALGGSADSSVAAKDVEAWRSQSSQGFELRIVAGGHFYVKDECLMRSLIEEFVPNLPVRIAL